MPTIISFLIAIILTVAVIVVLGILGMRIYRKVVSGTPATATVVKKAKKNLRHKSPSTLDSEKDYEIVLSKDMDKRYLLSGTKVPGVKILSGTYPLVGQVQLLNGTGKKLFMLLTPDKPGVPVCILDFEGAPFKVQELPSDESNEADPIKIEEPD